MPKVSMGKPSIDYSALKWKRAKKPEKGPLLVRVKQRLKKKVAPIKPKSLQ